MPFKPHVATVMHGDVTLRPLPETRAEAKAVGDTVLLGGDATATAFRSAIGKRPRWRAVHLACHGFVDVDRPQFSSLSLAGGFLPVADVFRARIPADLVVLSTCQTGVGRIYRGEGMIGFTRAFMQAGAPRIIVSLWKVDDEATKALMVKFYEFWNPKDGSKGLPTATALKRAQEFVCDGGGTSETERGVTRTKPAKRRTKWSHPYYWAAWQLWGLPD